MKCVRDTDKIDDLDEIVYIAQYREWKLCMMYSDLYNKQ